jgi:steroid 5-alpha reductase family enzyme
MGVPVEQREKPFKYSGVYIWTLVQLLGVALLHQLIFDFGEGLLTNTLGISTAGTSMEVRWVFFAAVIVRTFSQVLWAWSLLSYEMAPGGAVFVTLFNVVVDVVCALAMLHHRIELVPLGDGLLFAIFMVGILLERVSEFQRKAFKGKAENKGRPHFEGLFAVAVYANYSGFIIWRGAMAGLSGSILVEVLSLTMMMHSLITGDVENQRARNSKKYGKVFDDYFDRTPKMFPFVY